MTRPRLERTLFGAAAALSLSLGMPAMAADHRDAPTIDDYSAIDINDVYMFRMPADCTGGPNCKLVVGLSTQAVADPQFGSSYHFQENALYQLNFTTTATGFPTVSAAPTTTINFKFGPFTGGKQLFSMAFVGGQQTDGLETTQGTSAATHIPPKVNPVGGMNVFAGPREDPFFFDLVGFNRTIGSSPTANLFTGVDAFKGKNINAIVIEMPIETVFPATANCTTPAASLNYSRCGVWATTYLADIGNPNNLTQVDRMGNPAVNTALIKSPRKDKFNSEQPGADLQFVPDILGQIVDLDHKFQTCPAAVTDAFVCNPNTPLLASLAVPDVLRFASNAPDGYPNGRRLFDRTTDALISLILQIPNFTDGTDVKQYCLPQPDKHGKFLPSTVRKQPAVFPYLGPPLQLDDHESFKIVEQSCP